MYRITERGFQQLEKMWDPAMRSRLLRGRWRLFGLAHLLGVLKRHRLDLPTEALTYYLSDHDRRLMKVNKALSAQPIFVQDL